MRRDLGSSSNALRGSTTLPDYDTEPVVAFSAS
jgi:hypothetical protein